MEKYMGNKSKLMDFIYNAIEDNVGDKKRIIFDAFSGTTNVGKFFKQNGYSVISNDINDFSYVLEKCYICNSKLPKFKALLSSNFYTSLNFKKVTKTKSFEYRRKKLLSENENLLPNDYKNDIEQSVFLKLIVYLTYYATPADYDNSHDDGFNKKGLYEFLQRNYCEDGSNSKYINLIYKKSLDNLKKNYVTTNSSKVDYITRFYETYDIRHLNNLLSICMAEKDDKSIKILNNLLLKPNLLGVRKFFSLEHAKQLDIILNTICYWQNNSLLNGYEYDILLTSLIESVTIFSNTSATYQSFYKDYRANTLQSFRLIIPCLSLVEDKKKYIALQGDIFQNLNKANYDILYLDPPYNWRQYDSNYHLLNTIAKINSIDDIEKYEKGIIGTSGENRENKLKYTSLNQRSTFEKRLFSLIKGANCSLIALSYSDSESNHRVNNNGITTSEIENFFKDSSIFKVETFKKLEFCRQNFESRKSNKKQIINEILYIIEKR